MAAFTSREKERVLLVNHDAPPDAVPRILRQAGEKLDEENIPRFVRFAVNVMGVENDFTDPRGTAERGVEAMEQFFRLIGMPTNMNELLGREVTDEEIDHMVQMASRGGTITLGAIKVLKPADMRAIYEMARGNA